MIMSEMMEEPEAVTLRYHQTPDRQDLMALQDQYQQELLTTLEIHHQMEILLLVQLAQQEIQAVHQVELQQDQLKVTHQGLLEKEDHQVHNRHQEIQILGVHPLQVVLHQAVHPLAEEVHHQDHQDLEATK